MFNKFYLPINKSTYLIKYFIITNADENLNGIHYHNGLNIIDEEFNTDQCVCDGFYFTNAKNILSFLDNGINLRKVYLPINNKKFEMVKDPNENKWRSNLVNRATGELVLSDTANMLILGEKMSLSDPKTFEYLIECGADIHVNHEYALRWACKNGYLEVVKFLVESGADIHVCCEYPLRFAAKNGHLEVVNFLVENGAVVQCCQNYPLHLAAQNYHFSIVIFLIKKIGIRNHLSIYDFLHPYNLIKYCLFGGNPHRFFETI